MKKFLLSGLLTAMIFSIYAQTQVGRTRYDLQTNNSVGRRVAINPAGETIITYTRSHMSAPNFDDRGTGYNFSSNNGATWSTTNFTGTFNRIDSGRSGWPNVVYTHDKEVIISHFAGASLGGLQVLSRDLGTTNPWTVAILDGTNNITNLANAQYANAATWARAASNGDSIFVITSIAQVDMPGMTGGLVMYRSTDAGATWVGPDEIPLVNSSNFLRVSADDYALDMNKNGKIAIVLGDYQVEVLTSTDWGTTFTNQIVVETNDINGVPNSIFDPNGGTLDTLNTTDGSFSLVVDDNDMVHVWYGRQRMWKDLATTAGATYLPLTVGLAYWNDAMTEATVIHETRIAAEQIELCNPLFSNQVTDNVSGFQASLYSASYTSMPSAGYDNAGNIFVAYSGLRAASFDDVTDLASTNNLNAVGYHFRDVYLMKSSDNGATWVGPLNVSSAPMLECVYPGVPRKIYGTDVPVIWQQDTIPGVNLQIPTGAPDHLTVENEIMFNSVSLATIVTPTDITCPTLVEDVVGQNDVTAFIGCDIDFNAAFANDDVPTGPDALDYMMLDVSDNPITSASLVVGNNNVQLYIVDAAGNSSDTVEAIVVLEADITAPTVALIGPATVDVIISTSYTDPGITYSDNACQPTATPVEVDNVTPNIATVGTYTYEWTVTDNAGNPTTVIRTVNVISTDTDAPVFTDLGVQTENIEACDTWTDLGVTAFDNVDFDVTNSITSAIALGGSPVASVNTNVPGVYTITYTAIDGVPNPATYVRTITVADTQAPEITLSTTDPTIYVCKGGTFIAPNATATDCVTASPSLSNNGGTVVDVNTVGTYTVTYTAEDDATNEATKDIQVKVGEAPTPDFDFTVTGNNVSVTSTSVGANNWDWDWNDNSSHKFTPSTNHPYATQGTYSICLTVRNNFSDACASTTEESTVCKDVTVVIGIAEVEKLNSSVNIYPNPSNGLVNVNISQENLTNVEVSIVNIIGDVVSIQTIANTSKNSLVTFNLGENAAGVYIVNIKTEKANTSKKVIIK